MSGYVYLEMTSDGVLKCGLTGPVALADVPRLAAAVGDAAQDYEDAAAGAALRRPSPQPRAAPAVIIPFPGPAD